MGDNKENKKDKKKHQHSVDYQTYKPDLTSKKKDKNKEHLPNDKKNLKDDLKKYFEQKISTQ
ncbi:MAG: hypothetical protein M0T74_17295 [Desulfitobacterium hafniense]|nr:hypothetical protein [Desulfitobacterium hafniense]